MSEQGQGSNHPDFNGAIKDNEAAIFCDRVLWPAVNFLARFDFVGEAPIRSELHFERTIPRNGFMEKVCLTASIDPDYMAPEVDFGSAERVCSVSVTQEVTCPEVTDSLVGIAREFEPEIDDLSEEEQGLLEAWRTITYFFDDEDFKSGRTEGYVLRDIDGDILWDDDDMEPPTDDETVGITADQEDDLKALERQLAPPVETADLPEIRRLLGALGVSGDILAA